MSRSGLVICLYVVIEVPVFVFFFLLFVSVSVHLSPNMRLPSIMMPKTMPMMMLMIVAIFAPLLQSVVCGR